MPVRANSVAPKITTALAEQGDAEAQVFLGLLTTAETKVTFIGNWVNVSR